MVSIARKCTFFVGITTRFVKNICLPYPSKLRQLLIGRVLTLKVVFLSLKSKGALEEYFLVFSKFEE